MNIILPTPDQLQQSCKWIVVGYNHNPDLLWFILQGPHFFVVIVEAPKNDIFDEFLECKRHMQNMPEYSVKLEAFQHMTCRIVEGTTISQLLAALNMHTHEYYSMV